ncbi:MULTISPECIES: TAXI family TRAP transporter solute-binding subunit [Mumia]|uniref:TAXI family TRAP transporter solute-binding subunit n=1 Tax=Mumia xiangluensis TaxID=1678900 RepID=A0ABW1QG22_9ACTN|nr:MULTISPECIES: TAXI family TRAP transporter solute-binding subunit [Mumia]
MPDLPRRRALALLGLPLLAGVSGCVGRGWAQFDSARVRIATGNPGGVFVRYGRALTTVLETRLDGVDAQAHGTDASLENLRLVAERECDVGFSLGDAAADAVTSDDRDLVALARMYDSFVHLVVREDSGVRRVADLRTARIGVGAPGSGTRVIAGRILDVHGVREPTARFADSSLQDSADDLRSGRLDAFFFVSGLPNQAIALLSDQVPLRLLDLGDAVEPMVAAYGPQYVRAPIPPSAYGLPDAVSTLSVKNYLVANPAVGDDLAYAITRLVFEAQDEIERLEPGVSQPTFGAAIFTSPLALHPGALRYYRERGA